MSRVLVLGSSNVDLILRVPRFHRPGETIIAQALTSSFGGKGANQAAAAARLGARASLITKLGRDPYGDSYHAYLAAQGLGEYVLRDARRPTGLALVEVTPAGENRIIVAPGANAALTPGDLKRLGRAFKGAGVFVAQLEIPPAAVEAGLKMARLQGAITILNPAPAVSLSRGILSLVDFLVPNEEEAQALAGRPLKGRGDLPRIARVLQERGAGNVVITLGAQGVYARTPEEEIWMEAFSVKAVDTTAAGDAFVGGLACGLAEGRPLREVLRLANAAGALAVTRLGAQPSLPSARGVREFLKKKFTAETAEIAEGLERKNKKT